MGSCPCRGEWIGAIVSDPEPTRSLRLTLRRALLLLGLALFSALRTASAAPVRFEPDLIGGVASGAEATLRLVPQNASDSIQTIPLLLTGTQAVDLPDGGTWQVFVDSPSLWSAPQWIVPRRDEPLRVKLPLFPAASVTGLFLPSGSDRSATADVRIEPSPSAKGPKPPATPLLCPVEQDRFRCTVPAGRLDLRVRAGSAIPSYLWDVEIQPGEIKDLGRFPLKTGASVVGWVRAEDGSALAEAKVRLEPQTFGRSSEPSKIQGFQAMSVEAKTNARGFFQLEDPSPGTFIVSVSREGLATASRPGIEVRPELEARISDPLVLAQPLTVRLTLDPPVGPSGSPWRLILERKAEIEGLRGEVYRGEASPEGHWEQRGPVQGMYSLSVEDGEMRWLFEDLAVAQEQTALHVEVPVVRVRGRVHLGDEPLAATLWFGGRSGPRRSRFESNKDGELEGLLPEEGTWPIDLVSENGLRLKLAPVEVRKLPGKSYAQVDIRVPDTHLQGVVVDEQGKPVAGAGLLLNPLVQPTSTAETDTEGKFEVRGLPAGTVIVHAREGDRESEWVQARLEEAHETPSLRLVLRTRQTLHGRVFSLRGPVAGARVTAFSENDSGMGSTDDAITGAAGEFTVKLSGDAKTAGLSVIAPGHAIRMLKAHLGADRVVEIPLEPVGGTLVFDLGDLTVRELRRMGAGLLAHGGTFVPFAITSEWVQLQRTPQSDPHRLVLPNMEPGEYVFCVGGEANVAVTRGLEPPPSQCSRGHLGPLQELTLRMPPIPEKYLERLRPLDSKTFH